MIQHFDEPMRKFALVVLFLKGHGAPVESFFSSLSYQKPKIRNKLSFENLKIVATIRKYLKTTLPVVDARKAKAVTSRKRKKTTGVDTTSAIDNNGLGNGNEEERQETNDVTFSDNDNPTMDGEDLLREVVEGGQVAPTVQDIDFEDEFERMLQDVEEEGLAEFTNDIFDSEDPPATPTRVSCRGTAVLEAKAALRAKQQQQTETSCIHQRYDLKVLKQVEEWLDSERSGEAIVAGDGEGQENNNDNSNEYESKYTIDDIITF
jgi:hypothetical protein